MFKVSRSPHSPVPARRRGFSYVGLAAAVLCVAAAGLLWGRAASLGSEVAALRAKAAVLGAERPRTKNIEDVRVGEKVWAYDPTAGRWQAEKVIRPLVHEYAGDMVRISVAGRTVTATGNHPFWVAGGVGLFDRTQAWDVYPSDRAAAVDHGKGRWIAARDLQAGDLLVLRDGSRAPVDEVQVSYAKTKVYNLQVAHLHTYAVTDVGLAVHNKPCFPPGTLIAMGDGSFKPIERLELGDQVLAGGPLSTGPPRSARVVGLIRDFTACLVDVTFRTPAGGQATVTPTRYHPFWTDNRGWVDAQNLRAGDLLQDDCRRSMAVVSVTKQPRLGRTYNLEVEGVHTYYVLAKDSATTVLVHNALTSIDPFAPKPDPALEIIDGVRRAKAADMLGQCSVSGYNSSAGGTLNDPSTWENFPTNSLGSPYSNIDTTTQKGIDRWNDVMQGMQNPDTMPPIEVRTATGEGNLTNISDVGFTS